MCASLTRPDGVVMSNGRPRVSTDTLPSFPLASPAEPPAEPRLEEEPTGQVDIKIFPMEKAQVQPVDTGRVEPNGSSCLPPPTGSLQLG